MSNVDLSIIIVSYNTIKDILPCIKSVYESGFTVSLEIIVVDNGSSDNSLEAITEHFPDVQIIESGYNAGYAGGNNIGYKYSKGRNILFLNPDTIINKAALDHMVCLADSSSECGALGPKVLNRDGSLQKSCYLSPALSRSISSVLFLDYLPFWESITGIKTNYTLDEQAHEMEVDCVSGCCLLVKRKALEDAGAFDESYWMYGEEAELCERIREKGYKIIFTPAASIVHLGGASTDDHSFKMRLHVERNRRMFYAQHRGKIQLFLFKALLLFDTSRRIITSIAKILITAGTNKKHVLKLTRSCGLFLWQLGFIRQGDRPFKSG